MAEVRNRVRHWVGMAYAAKICQIISRKRDLIAAKIARTENRDRMARRIQGFILRQMYRRAVFVQ